MANQEHLDILRQGVWTWNQWRREHPEIQPDLRQADLWQADLSAVNLSGAELTMADLRRANLHFADLSGANLFSAYLVRATLIEAFLGQAYFKRANFREADLSRATFVVLRAIAADIRKLGIALDDLHVSERALIEVDLSEVNLCDAILIGTDLRRANLSEADLSGANLSGAKLAYTNLNKADLSRANLIEADLSRATLIETNLSGTTLKDCTVYGIAAWDVQLDGAVQLNLTITPADQPTVTVDNLKVAQFIYLLLNNAEIREVIDMIARKVVLILGRFTPKRKAILDAIRAVLRTHGYVPILFDFDKPASRDITETVSALAHLARFVIADITDAKSIPQELMIVVPNLPSVPVQPLILESQREYGMFEHFTRFPWVLPIYHYQDLEDLLASLQAKVIEPAQQKAQELAKQ